MPNDSNDRLKGSIKSDGGREARLAEALRANLKRRKQRERAQAEAEADADAKMEARPEKASEREAQ